MAKVVVKIAVIILVKYLTVGGHKKLKKNAPFHLPTLAGFKGRKVKPIRTYLPT